MIMSNTRRWDGHREQASSSDQQQRLTHLDRSLQGSSVAIPGRATWPW
jgi:hypothetical protein